MSFAVAEECGKLSEEEKISFPEVISRLAQSGIESYTVNKKGRRARRTLSMI
ncbi:MAG: hypothetical protein ACK5MA_10730 [Parachlamydiaceae bacterium]